MKLTPTQLADTDPTEYQRRVRGLKQLLGHQLTYEAEQEAANYGWRIYRSVGVDPHLEHEEDVVLFGQSISEPDLSDYWMLSIEPLETRKICIWPNRDWCDWDDYEEYASNKSDDYFTVDVSLDIDDEKLDQLIGEGMYDQKGGN